MSAAATTALLALLATQAGAALVTVYPAPREPRPYAAPLEILKDVPVEDPCAGARQVVLALESSIVETEARLWAYLMRRPGFSLSRLPRRPGAGLSDPAVVRLFYGRLAAWDGAEEVPAPSLEELRRVNDVRLRVRLVQDVCPQARPVAQAGPADGSNM